MLRQDKKSLWKANRREFLLGSTLALTIPKDCSAWTHGSVIPSGFNLRLLASSIAQGDGSTVSTWPDTGGGHNLTFSSGPGALLWLSGATIPYVEIATTILANASFSLNKQAASFLIVLQYQSVATTAYTLNFGSIDAVLINQSTALTMFNSGNTTLHPSSGRIAILVTMGTGNVKVYLDASANVQSLPAYSAGSVTGFELSGAGGLSANVYDIIGWNRELNSTEIAALLNVWAPAVYGTGKDALTPTGRVIFVGDSLTYGLGATKGRNYPFYVNVSSSWLWYSEGVTGEAWSDIVAREASTFIFANSTNWLIAFAGTNDVSDGKSVATMQSGITTYMGDAVAAGFVKANTVVFTLSVQNLGAGGTVRNDYNTWLRANFSSFAGFLVDLVNDPQLGSSLTGVPFHPEFWFDGAHYNDAGYVLLAALVRSTIGSPPF